MFNRLPLNPNDLLALLRRLTDSPLLIALFLISPADALRVMGFEILARFFDDLGPSTPEDAQRARMLVQSLTQGRTTADAQIVQPAALPAPVEPAPETGTPDVRLSVSGDLLRHLVARYAARGFTGQVFTLPAQRWGTLRATGQTLALTIDTAQARITATFQGAVTLTMALPLGANVNLGTIETPVVLDIRSTLSVDQERVLSLDIRHAEIRLPELFLPEIVARELVRQLIAAIPSIPLVTVPGSFELPGAEGQTSDLIDLQIPTVRIEPDGLHLLFQLAE